MRKLSFMLLLLGIVASCTSVAQPVADAPSTDTPVPPTEELAEPTATPLPDLDTDLIAYYPFNGDANDASGKENHGVVHGATLVSDRFENADSAYSFDGVDDFIEIPHSTDLLIRGAASFSAWIQFEPQAQETWYTIFEKSDPERDGHSRWGMWLIRDKAEFCVQSMNAATHYCLDSKTSLEQGAWAHVVGVWTGDTIQMYLDGELELETSHGRSALNATGFPLYIGTDPFNQEQLFTKGSIDDIRIYKRTISAEEVRELFELQP